MIVNMNLTPYMSSPDQLPKVRAYAQAVKMAVEAGRVSGPFTTTCPECGNDYADREDVVMDDNHIIFALTSDTFAVVVACEGYYMVDPNLVGIDSPMWSNWAELPGDVKAEDFR
jgi:hypothetical protein